MPSLIIFDVGHGSSALLQDGAVRTVFDCKDAPMLIEFLLANGINTIEQVVISHTDSDHIAGVSALLQSDHVQIGTVYINPDAAKNSDMWQELKLALADAVKNKGLHLMPTIGANMPQPLQHQDVRIEVLAPGIVWQLTTHGGRLPNGQQLNNANSMSAVIRLVHQNHPVVLLPGDMDMAALGDIIARQQSLAADILVFPHHGGHVSGAATAAAKRADNVAFTTELVNRCTPRMVVFSIGRGIHATPRAEIIQQIRSQQPACVISCTQLSENCRAEVPVVAAGHLGVLPARGKAGNRCCGGSLEIQFAGDATVAGIQRAQHAAFIAAHATTPLCTAAAPVPAVAP